MNTYKVIVDGAFKTTIKGVNADEIYSIAERIYGYNSDIKVVFLS